MQLHLYTLVEHVQPGFGVTPTEYLLLSAESHWEIRKYFLQVAHLTRLVSD